MSLGFLLKSARAKKTTHFACSFNTYDCHRTASPDAVPEISSAQALLNKRTRWAGCGPEEIGASHIPATILPRVKFPPGIRFPIEIQVGWPQTAPATTTLAAGPVHVGSLLARSAILFIRGILDVLRRPGEADRASKTYNQKLTKRSVVSRKPRGTWS